MEHAIVTGVPAFLLPLFDLLHSFRDPCFISHRPWGLLLMTAGAVRGQMQAVAVGGTLVRLFKRVRHFRGELRKVGNRKYDTLDR